MQQALLERLQKDDQELEVYARKLEKKGHFDRMKLILEKQLYLKDRIAEVSFST